MVAPGYVPATERLPDYFNLRGRCDSQALCAHDYDLWAFHHVVNFNQKRSMADNLINVIGFA